MTVTVHHKSEMNSIQDKKEQPWWQYYYQLYQYQLPPGRKPTVFGPFLLLQTLGEGEFGKVKFGIEIKTGQEVAIKLIRKDSINTNSRMVKVEREISVLKVLHHPNIVKLYDVIETEKYIGIILQCATGGELFDYILARRYLKEKDASRLFAQLISGVHYMHQKQIVHRDLKLENLLLDKHRNVLITDFGFANQFSSPQNDLMSTSCGSPCYAAPELVMNKGRYGGHGVDIWSCGVILFAMLCGYLPYDDDPDNPESYNINLLYKYILNTPLVFPSYLSQEACDLVRLMLVPDPQERCSIETIMSHPWLSQHQDLFQSFETNKQNTKSDTSIDDLVLDSSILEDEFLQKQLDHDLDKDTRVLKENLIPPQPKEPSESSNKPSNQPDLPIKKKDPASSRLPVDPLPKKEPSKKRESAKPIDPLPKREPSKKPETSTPIPSKRPDPLPKPEPSKKRESSLLSKHEPFKRPEPTKKKETGLKNSNSDIPKQSESSKRQPREKHPTPILKVKGQDRPTDKVLQFVPHEKQKTVLVDPSNSKFLSSLKAPPSVNPSISTPHPTPSKKINPVRAPVVPTPDTRRKTLSLLVNSMTDTKKKSSTLQKRSTRPSESMIPSISEYTMDDKEKHRSPGKKIIDWFKKKPQSKSTMNPNPSSDTSSDIKLRIHHGVVDQEALTSKSPLDMMQQLKQILTSHGLDCKQDGDYKLRCVRPHKKLVTTTSARPTYLSRSPQPNPSASLRMLLRRTSVQHQNTIYGDPNVDPGEEVRFSIEICKIKNLTGLYIIDVRRLRGNVWAYKFIYRTLMDSLKLKDDYLNTPV